MSANNYVIAPLSDSYFAPNIEENYKRQAADARLIVVENNGGRYNGEAWRVIQSPPGKTAAINAAMELVEPGFLVVCFDQDDWYGSESLQAKYAALQELDIVGMPKRWVRFPTGHLWHFENHHLTSPGRLWAGSLAWRASAFEPMGDYYLGCEIDWLVSRVKEGCSFELRDFPDVYVRHDRKHTWERWERSHERLVRSGVVGDLTDLGVVPWHALPQWVQHRNSPKPDST